MWSCSVSKTSDRQALYFGLIIAIATLLGPVVGRSYAANPPADDDQLAIPPAVQNLFSSYCLTCHDADAMKGKVQLDNLSQLSVDARLELLNRVQEQVYSGEMPPKKADQPASPQRDVLVDWVTAELKKHHASKLDEKLRYYKFGNYVNHEKLFSGEIKEQPFTRARSWRINELIYNERVNDVFELKGRDRQASFHGIVKPFKLPSESGVKYYDNLMLEGGEVITLLNNAKWIADKQLRPALLKSGDFKYPQEYLDANPARRRTTFPDEQWNPKTTAPELERVVMTKGSPSDADLAAAIAHQFQVALQRPPTPEEASRYLSFTRSAMEVAGKILGLKKMMVSVIMEPEFIFRSEFGDGHPDSAGRMKLAPREASYAIAYALTDRIPDAKLVEAAASNKLNSREDYKREVLRMLDDNSIEKPRILRFFQDYFGYYGVFDVFKDEERFGGNYNPHRVVSTRYIYRVPGKISQECDTLIQYILKQDRDVLKQLLTTDQYFVQHNGDNAAMAAAQKKAAAEEQKSRDLYEKLKGKKGPALTKAAEEAAKEGAKNDWRSNPQVILRRMQALNAWYGPEGRQLPPKDALPADALEHSIKMYNLDWHTWAYQPVQPIKIEHRAGILTHPAWLVSFSQNAHTDPVRRGKWIREKLLAGFIPDVPITVDARVPEDPHKTLRDRFSVTNQQYCWRCHSRMNPLGYSFESFDDFGRYRTQESLEYPENVLKMGHEVAPDVNGVFKKFDMPVYKTAPVQCTSELDGTGDKALDGPIQDVPDLMNRLAKSDRVRQSFIRNVFRYFMGRNETLADSQTLIDADKAYVESGGSFKALMVSILTSDSFIYRKVVKD
jgi:mono/diheme cytochrome c family protein